jgi:hypothetical protein
METQEDGKAIYEACPLPNPRAQIRLLQYDEDGATGLPFSMRTFDLDEHLSYSAVSYVWGDSANPGVITVNGRAMSVSQNCLYAWVKSRASFGNIRTSQHTFG